MLSVPRFWCWDLSWPFGGTALSDCRGKRLESISGVDIAKNCVELCEGKRALNRSTTQIGKEIGGRGKATFNQWQNVGKANK